MTVLNQLRKQFEIDGIKFTAIRNGATSLWTLETENKKVNGSWTRFPLVQQAAQSYANNVKKIKKEVSKKVD